MECPSCGKHVYGVGLQTGAPSYWFLSGCDCRVEFGKIREDGDHEFIMAGVHYIIPQPKQAAYWVTKPPA
jgi:hypothetical protein